MLEVEPLDHEIRVGHYIFEPYEYSTGYYHRGVIRILVGDVNVEDVINHEEIHRVLDELGVKDTIDRLCFFLYDPKYCDEVDRCETETGLYCLACDQLWCRLKGGK